MLNNKNDNLVSLSEKKTAKEVDTIKVPDYVEKAFLIGVTAFLAHIVQELSKTISN